MNFSEFKKRLGADPRNRDPDTLEARSSGAEFEAFAAEAEDFESRLEASLDMTVDSAALLEEILAIPGRARRITPRWMALAASLVMAAGAASLYFTYVRQPDTIEEYVAVHYAHDGASLLGKADEIVSEGKVRQVMASWGLEASPEMSSRVLLIKKCFTMDGLGAHMIVQSEHGPVNLIVMPNTQVRDRQTVSFGNMNAYLVSLGDFSAAIIGESSQAISNMDGLVRNGFVATT